MSLATVAAVVNIGSGINSIVQSNKNKSGGGGTTDQAAQAADPFGQFRTQYAQEFGKQYNNLANFNPADVTKDPNYQFQLDQGIGAINKGAAASGMLGSGTRMLDLEKFGQGLASSFSDKQFGRGLSLLQMLGGASGATTGNPAAAGSAIMNGNNNAAAQGNYGLNSITSGLNGLGKVNWSNFNPFNGGGSGTGADVWGGPGGYAP